MVEISENLHKLAEAKTLHAKAATRTWLFLATASLAVIAAEKNERGNLNLLGFELIPERFFLASFVLIWMGIFVFCNKHAMTLRTGDIFKDAVKKHSNKLGDFTGEFNYEDFYHSLFDGDLIRSSPLSRLFGKNGTHFYQFSGYFASIVYFAVPITGLIVALMRANPGPIALLLLVASAFIPIYVTFVTFLATLGSFRQ
jgi:hypothetical protein